MHRVIVVPAEDSENLHERGLQLATRLHLPYVPRRKRTWTAIYQEEQTEAILIVRGQKIEYHQGETVFSFHPGLAGLRILALDRGQADHMVTAMGLREGDQVLDCTLGLASDAVVASFAVGTDGRVVGVEASPLVAAVVADGLQRYRFPKDPRVEAAMRRIEVVTGNHLEILRRASDRSYDVVYFDPMFRHAIEESDGIGPLRALANHEPVSVEALGEAKRVARRRVVIKERSGSAEFQRLVMERTVGGRYGPIAYGVIDCE
ncbi:MAG: class I SAM-dependent methyltransferase [Bacillota bacterium]